MSQRRRRRFGRKPAPRPRHRTPRLETLESRQVLSVSAVGSPLLVNNYLMGLQTTEASQQAVAYAGDLAVVTYGGQGAYDRHGIYVTLLNADGSVAVAPKQVNTTVRGVQSAPAVAELADGSLVIAWTGRGPGDKQGIFLQRVSATGELLGAETLVNQTTGGAQVDPALAVAADGSFIVAWSGVGTGDVNGVFFRRFTAAGVAMGGEVRANTTTTNEQSAPAVGFDDAGNLLVAWQSRHQDGSDWGIYGQWYTAAGATMGSETRLTTTTSGSQSAPVVATDPTGGIVVAWQSHGQDGSGWGIVGRHFGNGGNGPTSERVLNDPTTGNQTDVALAVAEDGQWLVSWTSDRASGLGREVRFRSFEGDGTANDSVSVSNGRGSASAVAVSDEHSLVAWSGSGTGDSRGVYGRRYDVEIEEPEPNVAPAIVAIDDKVTEVGAEIVVVVTASDANAGDVLTFALDTANSPVGATIEKTSATTAVIRWTPGEEDEGMERSFRVVVTDNGNPVMMDDETFTVAVGDQPVVIDLNGAGTSGVNSTANFVAGGGAVLVTGPELDIRFAADGMIQGVTIRIANPPTGSMESLSIDKLDTNISVFNLSETYTISLSGADTVENYERVLRTLRYNNAAEDAVGDSLIEIRVADADGVSEVATIEVNTVAPDLVAFAQALDAAGVKFFGAAWCPFCTQQKQLFEDGAHFLPFIESTNPDRTLNETGMANNITTFPTWVFPDGTRLENLQSLQALAEAAGIDIPLSDQPFLAPLANETLLVGSPLHIPLDGYDPNGGPLTYEVTVEGNAGVTATVLEGNRSARIKVKDWGDMVFELFEGRATRATDNFIELAEDDFYKDIIFHRVINGFVIQAGDPEVSGVTRPEVEDFDDHFHEDLQHNRGGLLSMAKLSQGGQSIDDSNSSQFFITEGPTRNLDFNHSIFGILVEGEDVREAISNTKVSGSQISPRPDIDVVMEDIEIFEDTENAVLMLKAAPGATGTATINVKVTDAQGNSTTRTFQVNLQPDTVNNTPFLHDIPPIATAPNTPVEVTVGATDVEGDEMFFFVTPITPMSEVGEYEVAITDEGVLTITPPADFTGTLEIAVGVGSSSTAFPDDMQRVSVEVA